MAAAYFGNRLVIAALTGAIRAFGNVGFEVGIVVLWIVAHDAALDAAEVAFHATHSGAS